LLKKSQFTEEQILGVLRQVEGGRTIVDVCREHGISDATYHRWKGKYGGLEVSQLRRLKQLEDENRKLKQLVGELTLDNAALKDVVAKKW
jgi:putative transposase